VRRSAGAGVGGTYAGDPALGETDCGRTLTVGRERGAAEEGVATEYQLEPSGRGLLIRVMRGGDTIDSKLCVDPLGDAGERPGTTYGVGMRWWVAAVFGARLAGIGTGADAGAGTSERVGPSVCLLLFSGPLCGSRATFRVVVAGVGVEVVRPLRIE
jgi:hypothetical protein